MSQVAWFQREFSKEKEKGKRARRGQKSGSRLRIHYFGEGTKNKPAFWNLEPEPRQSRSRPHASPSQPSKEHENIEYTLMIDLLDDNQW
jgi:hypothetical protein